MEFLRFGSSIPGGYWGCCAVCIIQNFKVMPDAKAAIQLVVGDSGSPLMRDKENIFAGPTNLDIFLQRLRIGTFSGKDMPNHVFLAVLTEYQISGEIGKAWLKVLKEQGFEFVRTTDNSVYTGETVITKTGTKSTKSPHKNYIFGLFRNVGQGFVEDPFTPPAAWTDLDAVIPEPWLCITDGKTRNKETQAAHLKLYKALPKEKWMKESEVLAAGIVPTMAGQRSKFPQEPKNLRDVKIDVKVKEVKAESKGSAKFPTASTVPA
jgi:hypothetical protein